MKKRYCIKCGVLIPEGRIKAVPNTSTCTIHSNEDKYYVNQIISNDEEYTELQFIKDPNVIEELRRYKNETPIKPSLDTNLESESE